MTSGINADIIDMRVFKTRHFAREAYSLGISDAELMQAANEVAMGNMVSVYANDVSRSIHEDAEGNYSVGATNVRRMLYFDHGCLTREAWRAVKKWRRHADRKECAPDYLHSIGLMSDEEWEDYHAPIEGGAETLAAQG